MSTESRNFNKRQETRDKNYPSAQDFQDLEIKVQNLGRGDIIHECKYHLGMLERVLASTSKTGWNDGWLEIWNKEVVEINKLVTQVRMNQAREKGLL